MTDFNQLTELTLDEIFALNDDCDLTSALHWYLFKRQQNDKDFSEFTEDEKTFYMCCELTEKYECDGFFGFIESYHYRPIFFNTEQYLRKIGANAFADVYHTAINSVKNNMPIQNEAFLERCKREDMLEKKLLKYSKEAFSHIEEVKTLCAGFARKNKDNFT